LSFSSIADERAVPILNVKKATGKIIVDGILDEPDWQTANIAGDFFQNFPYDTSYAITKTEVKVTHDDEFIYIAAICYDHLEGDYVIQSLKRDFSYPVSDAFAVFIDPFNDKLNGFSFAVNPLGVQREGLLEGGAFFGVTTSWDNKWYSEVTRQGDRWTVEMAIPLKTIRYKGGTKVWGINFSRNDLKRNENSSWSPVPRNFNIASTAFSGELEFEDPPTKAGTNISLIPYAIGNTNRDFTSDSTFNYGVNAGLDAKVAVTSSLNLDITVNPDFSQVEVDKQIVNLTRFNLFFPEKRQFFIENSDLFSRYGFRQIRPFFSRNIGLKNGQIVPILAGARLSGKVNKNWRIGLMNLQTEGVSLSTSDTTFEFVQSQNYTVAAVQRQIGRSNIAGIFVNRQSYESEGFSPNDYNRIVGLDFNLNTKSNNWFGKAFYHYSITPYDYKDNVAHAVWFIHSSEKIFAMWNHEYVGENYLADVGFVPRIQLYNPDSGRYERRSYWRFEPEFTYRIYPKSSSINNHSISAYLSEYLDKSFSTTEHIIKLSYKIKFQNTSEFNIEFMDNYIDLPFATDISRIGNTPIPKGEYKYQNFKIEYISNKRALGYFTMGFDYGSFYNGMKTSYSGEYSFRKQPWGIFSVNITRDEIDLPNPYDDASLTLIGPNIELSFTKSFFFTTFIQYNTQLDNVNINSRLQWRFKPMSDLYIVYTDNYYSPDMSVRNRALVLKLIYWLSI